MPAGGIILFGSTVYIEFVSYSRLRAHLLSFCIPGSRCAGDVIFRSHLHNLLIVVTEAWWLNMWWFGGYLNPLSRISFKFTSHFYTPETAHFRHTRLGSFQEQPMKILTIHSLCAGAGSSRFISLQITLHIIDNH